MVVALLICLQERLPWGNNMVGIYKITNPLNEIYIGQSWDIDDRIGFYKKAKCENQPLLYKSILEHSWNNHKLEIVCELPGEIDQISFDLIEISHIDFYKEAGYKMLNVRGGGSRGKHSDATKKLMREKKKQDFKDNPEKYENFKKSVISPENRKKASEKANRTKSTRIYKKITGKDHWNYGKPSRNRDRIYTEGNILNLRKAQKSTMRPVEMLDLNGIFLRSFESINEAARTLNFSKQAIKYHCNGLCKKGKLGYILKFA